jgi:hypothetical protein
LPGCTTHLFDVQGKIRSSTRQSQRLIPTKSTGFRTSGAYSRFTIASPGMGKDNASHTRTQRGMLPCLLSQYSMAGSSMRSTARISVRPASETQ